MDQFDAGGPFGLEVPAEVLFAAKLFTAIEDESEIENESIISTRELDSLIELCIAYACEKRFSRRRFVAAKRAVLEHWKRNHAALCAQLALTSHDFDRLFAGLLRIVECVRRNWINYADLEAGSDSDKNHNRLKRELIRQAKIGEKLADRIFAHILRSKLRISIFADRDSSNTRFATGNRLISIRWRIDVVICDRTLSKIMEPIVRLQLIFANGACGDGDGNGDDRKMANFEIRLPIFHRLRFMVACALKECAALENRLHLSSGSTST